MKLLPGVVLTATAFVFSAVQASGGDWPRFRGPNGSAVADESNLPVTWSDSKNLKWTSPLPGPGSSSPIVVGGKVFVTSYSGYGESSRRQGSQRDLRRHLVCLDAETGKKLWTKTVEPVLPEDSPGFGLSEHGYASHTPVCDGERVYVFFGKTGAMAFDMKGRQLWKKGLGTESGRMRFGSGSSPILYKNLVIFTASEESKSIRALDRKTGKQVWKAEADGLGATWGTPALVKTKDGQQQLVIGVAYEVWGLSPDTGKLLWFAETGIERNMCSSVVVGGDIVYAVGGRRGASAAIRAGGKGDTTKTNVLWAKGYGSYVPSPVLVGGRLHWVDSSGIAYCMNAKDGKLLYRQRLPGGGRNGFYSSMIAAGEKLYAVSRRSGTFVLAAGIEFKQLAVNKFASDSSDFNGSPAVANGRLYLRSNGNMYCVEQKPSP